MVSQDRLLTEIRDDDTVMLEKISLLENHLRKTRQEVGTQTEFESYQFTQKSLASIPDREHLRYVAHPLLLYYKSTEFTCSFILAKRWTSYR